jgi:hypothetical protein
MGPHLDYDWSRILRFDGVSVRDDELCLNVFDSNLEREPFEDRDGITEGATGTRLDQLLRFLTWATVGPEGEVVGCMTNEHMEGHAHPLVRCGDGRIRVVTTGKAHDDGWFSPVIEVAEVPALLPCDLIGEVGGAWARLDFEALRERYLAVDGFTASNPSCGPALKTPAPSGSPCSPARVDCTGP